MNKLNRSRYLLLGWAILAGLTACKEPTADGSASPTPVTDQPGQTDGSTDVGQPNGQLISKMIGPDGGTIATDDGRIQLVIPAGALDKSTAITIQPITSYTPNGIGQAYRFSPDGTKFSKPATLTFQYTTASVSVNAPDVFGVAYQGADKVWYAVPDVKTDVAKQEISVPMSHFSDWSAVERGQISRISSTEEAQLENLWILSDSFYDIVGYGETKEYWVSEVSLPEGKSEKPLIEKPVSNENWSLLGQGTGKLIPNGSKATYIAPNGISSKSNPVTLSVEVYFENSKTKVIINQKIIVGLGYVTCSFRGEDYIFTDVELTSDGVKAYRAATGMNDYIFVYTYGMKAGLFQFGSTEPGTSQIQFVVGTNSYDSFPGACYDKPIVTNGSVNVIDYNPNQRVMGYFTGSLLDDTVNNCGGHGGGEHISGYYILKNKG